jgi:hypothetical protein
MVATGVFFSRLVDTGTPDAGSGGGGGVFADCFVDLNPSRKFSQISTLSTQARTSLYRGSQIGLFVRFRLVTAVFL